MWLPNFITGILWLLCWAIIIVVSLATLGWLKVGILALFH